MLKITRTETNGKSVVLKLEGKIMRQWATLLDQECRTALKANHKVELDCAGVDYVDEQGLEVLKKLPTTKVTLISTPGYMTELLHIGGQS